jgi:hypothetical protein
MNLIMMLNKQTGFKVKDSEYRILTRYLTIQYYLEN